jgi:hypothetical protein
MRDTKAQCQGIRQPKELPIIDSYLRRQVGHISKKEEYLSHKAVAAINRLSRYQAFRLLLIYFGRRIQHEGLKRTASGIPGVCRAGISKLPW